MAPALDIALDDAWQPPLSLSCNPVSTLQKTQAAVLERQAGQRGPKDATPHEGELRWPA